MTNSNDDSSKKDSQSKAESTAERVKEAMAGKDIPARGGHMVRPAHGFDPRAAKSVNDKDLTEAQRDLRDRLGDAAKHAVEISQDPKGYIVSGPGATIGRGATPEEAIEDYAAKAKLVW